MRKAFPRSVTVSPIVLVHQEVQTVVGREALSPEVGHVSHAHAAPRECNHWIGSWR